jgi:Ti-type conjugative transfer relaxase TraA
MIPRCTIGKGITGAARYILGEGRDRETGEVRRQTANGNSRVSWIGGTGFGFPIDTAEDADLARRVMEFDAQNQTSRTRPCEKDCVHLSLAWRPGETPNPQQMEAAALEALATLGMANARALFAIHSDEGYAHIHIVASKIDPATGRAYDLKENYLKLSRWAEAYERKHSGGVVCTGREAANELRDAIDKRDTGAVLELMVKQRATFSARDLDRPLAKQIKNRFERSRFGASVLGHAEAVALSDEPGGPITRYTTKTVLEAEGHVLRAAQGLAQNDRHKVPDRLRADTLARERFAGITGEQADAFRRATDAEGLALIDGQAGTGKSYTMAAIREAYEAAGRQVIGLAPTNAVALDMRREGFRGATTIHSKLFALNNGRARWNRRTIVMVDEAAMIDTRLMAMLTAHAWQSGAKLILVGDDRQLSSIDRGGMFAALKERYGAASLTEVRRQKKHDDRRATELMAEGNFDAALARYDARGDIRWTETPDEARAALVRQWAADTEADPAKSRFVFAYTNADVDLLNRDLRLVRQARGELGRSHGFQTKHGWHEFASGDQLQFTGTDKALGVVNGHAGIVANIEDSRISVRLDGPEGRLVAFDAEAFRDFRHGYAGTIYKGQGRTLDQTYLYHSAHWRSAASYVALSRHREKAELFVARTIAADLKTLARQMARVDDRRAASQFYHEGELPGPVRPLTPAELLARLTGGSRDRQSRRDRTRANFVEAASGGMTRRIPPPTPIKDSTTGPSLDRVQQMATKPPPQNDATKRADVMGLWRRVAAWLTQFRPSSPARPGAWNPRRRDGPQR